MALLDAIDEGVIPAVKQPPRMKRGEG